MLPPPRQNTVSARPLTGDSVRKSTLCFDFPLVHTLQRVTSSSPDTVLRFLIDSGVDAPAMVVEVGERETYEQTKHSSLLFIHLAFVLLFSHPLPLSRAGPRPPALYSWPPINPLRPLDLALT